MNHSQVADSCEMRRPNSLHITVMNSGGTVNTTTVQHDHQSGSQVTLSIELPQNVDMCSLVVTIRAGNSAGMSSPTEIQVGRCSCFIHWIITNQSHEQCRCLCMQNVPLSTQRAPLLPALELTQFHQLSLVQPHQLLLKLNKEITSQQLVSVML